MKAEVAGLYALTPETDDTPALLAAVRTVLENGARLVQYRDKSADVARRHEQAAELLILCRAFGVPLLINDDVRLADLSGADGVHLGETDTSPAHARLILGPDRLIGVSCYDRLERALDAVRAGADYVAFGSFYPSATKAGAVRAPLRLLGEAKRALRLPVVAIGGITPDNAAHLRDAGADAVAVLGGVFADPDSAAAAARLAALFG